MKFQADTQHIKSIAVRFGNAHQQERKNEKTYKQLIRLGSALLFVQEWYDIHNKNREYYPIWHSCVQVLSIYDIKPHMIGRIVQDSENHLTYREGKRCKSQELAIQLASFVNPFRYDKDGFLEEITQRTHPALQQAVGSLVFSLIHEWGVTDIVNSHQDIKTQLMEYCEDITDYMCEQYGKEWFNLDILIK